MAILAVLCRLVLSASCLRSHFQEPWALRPAHLGHVSHLTAPPVSLRRSPVEVLLLLSVLYLFPKKTEVGMVSVLLCR